MKTINLKVAAKSLLWSLGIATWIFLVVLTAHLYHII